MRVRRPMMTVATAAALLAIAPPVKAESAPTVDWARVILDLDAIARRGTDILARPRCFAAGCVAEASAPFRRDPPNDLTVQSAGNAWFGVGPRVSLVARDWGNAFKVAGDRLGLVDAMRLTSSTRMVLSRVRLNSSRVTPFAQIGVGQWRTDPNLLPHTPRDIEIAAQFGGGIEMTLLPRWHVAAESTATVLYRERSDAPDAVRQMWSTTFASRVTVRRTPS